MNKRNMNESSPTIRVLHVLGWLGSGGIEKLLVSLMENMDRETVAFDFLLFTHENAFYNDYVQELGSKLHYLDVKQYKWKLTYQIAKFMSFYKFMKTGKYSIVHLHDVQPNTYIYAFLAKKAGVKSVIIHAHNTKSLTETRTRILPLFKLFFGRYPSYYLACSQEAADYMWPKHLKSDKGCILLNGIDFDTYTFSEDKRRIFREENKLDDKYVVGHIGRFAEQKNHPFLLRVFEKVKNRIPSSVLLLIGAGKDKEKIQKMASKMGIIDKVIFYGTTKDVPSALMGMDVMCFPSIYEGLGIVAIEAQAASLPIVVSDGVPESANISEYYYKLNLSEPEEKWAELICSFYGKSVRKANNAHMKKTEYDIRETANKITKVYQALATRND